MGDWNSRKSVCTRIVLFFIQELLAVIPRNKYTAAVG